SLLRADSDTFMDGSQSGIATPPLGGVLTPAGANGMFGGQGDSMDIDGPSINGLPLGHGIGDDVEEDTEYKIWKQVTKKDRAQLAAERNRLFKGDKLNADEPALLRTKSGMRRWIRRQRQALADATAGQPKSAAECKEGETGNPAVETLAQGME